VRIRAGASSRMMLSRRAPLRYNPLTDQRPDDVFGWRGHPMQMQIKLSFHDLFPRQGKPFGRSWKHTERAGAAPERAAAG
jgi:hypothetical protein